MQRDYSPDEKPFFEDQPFGVNEMTVEQARNVMECTRLEPVQVLLNFLQKQEWMTKEQMVGARGLPDVLDIWRLQGRIDGIRLAKSMFEHAEMVLSEAEQLSQQQKEE